jgi:hypothetical protein
MKSWKKSDKALNAWLEAVLETDRKILPVGPAGRTWKTDVALMRDLLELCMPCTVLCGGIKPFDIPWVRDAAAHLDMPLIHDDPYVVAQTQTKDILGRSSDLYEIADGILAFPLENAPPVSRGGTILRPTQNQVQFDVHTADPGMPRSGRPPTLVVYRYFTWEFLP